MRELGRVIKEIDGVKIPMLAGVTLPKNLISMGKEYRGRYKELYEKFKNKLDFDLFLEASAILKKDFTGMYIKDENEYVFLFKKSKELGISIRKFVTMLLILQQKEKQ